MLTGHCINIQGISWHIPCICPSHFTAADFQYILSVIASDCGFVWVDVACIDQENVAIKMDEIVKQADIFRRAKKVHACVTAHSTDQLISLTSHVDRFSRELERLEISGSGFEYDEANIRKLVSEDVGACLAAVTKIISDPWFTSLWTLEEAYLRDDAVLLSRTGGTVPRKPFISNAMLLYNLCGDFQTINLALAPYKSISHELECLLQRVKQSGIINVDVATAAPMLLYSAPRFCTTTQELDRIYGIMQVYNLKFGASQSPNRDYQVEELEHQLAVALNIDSATAAQIFIHVKSPLAGPTRRISQHYTMPEVYCLCDIVEERCKLSFTNSATPTSEGTFTSVIDLKNFWKQAVERGSDVYVHEERWWHHYRVNINLDANQDDACAHEKSFELVQEAQEGCPCTFCTVKPSSQKQGLSSFLASLPWAEACYSVLLLGWVTLYKASGPRSGVTVSSWAGLLVVEEIASSGEPRRIRVCTCSWEAAERYLKPVPKALWNPCAYRLG